MTQYEISSVEKGNDLECKVAEIYRIFGYNVYRDTKPSGQQIDLTIEYNLGTIKHKIFIECKNREDKVKMDDVDKFITRLRIEEQKTKFIRGIIVCEHGFAPDSKKTAEEYGVECKLYKDLERELIDFSPYVDSLRNSFKEFWELPYEPLVSQEGEISEKALDFLKGWIYNTSDNLLVLIGDDWIGRSWLVKKFVYEMADIKMNKDTKLFIPIYLKLESKYYTFRDIETFIFKYIEENVGTPRSQEKIRELLKKGFFQLIIDGFDLVLHKSEKGDIDRVKNIFKELPKLVGVKGKIIIPLGTSSFRNISDMKKVILDYDDNEAESVLNEADEPDLSEEDWDQNDEADWKEFLKTIVGEPELHKNIKIAYIKELRENCYKRYFERELGPHWKKLYLKEIKNYGLEDFFKNVHFLSYIPGLLKKIEDIKKKGEIVSYGRLYGWICYLCLIDLKEKGNSVINEIGEKNLSHKEKKILSFFRHLAFRLWEKKEESIGYQLLYESIDSNIIQAYYEILTSPFLRRDIQVFLRSDSKESDSEVPFRFFHPSLMYYFLAKKVIKIINKEGYDVLKENRLPMGTVVFIVDLEWKKRQKWKEDAKQIITQSYEKHKSENALLIYSEIVKREVGYQKGYVKLPKNINLYSANGADLTAIELIGIDWQNSDLSNVDFGQASLRHCNFSGTTLKECKFINTDLSFSDFSNLKLKNVNFSYSNLDHTNFSESDLGKTIFIASYLNNTNFTGAKMEKIEFERAAFKETKGINDLKIKTALLAGKDKVDKIKITLQMRHRFKSEISFIADHKCKEILVTGYAKKYIKLWDKKNGTVICTEGIESENQLQEFLNNKTEEFMATKNAYFENKDEGFRKTELYESVLEKIDFNPDDNTLAVVSKNILWLWDINGGNLINQHELNNPGHIDIRFSPTGKELAIIFSESLILWNIYQGKSKEKIEGESLSCMSFFPKAKCIGNLVDMMMAYSQKFEIYLKNLIKKKKNRIDNLCIKNAHENRINSLDLSLNANYLVSISHIDYTMKIWDVKNWDVKKAKENKKKIKEVLSISGFLCASFSPDSKLLILGSNTNKICLWDVEKEKKEICDNWLEGVGHSAEVECLTFTQDGKYIASGSRDNTIKIWKIEKKKGKLLYTLKGHLDDVKKVVFSKNGRILISASLDNTIKFWDVAGRQLLLNLWMIDIDTWVAWTDDNKFACPLHAFEYVKFVDQERLAVYPAEAFKDDFFEEDLIKNQLQKFLQSDPFCCDEDAKLD